MMKKEVQDESVSSNNEEQTKGEPITYGDIFRVSYDLGKEPITVKDAAMMQSAETRAAGRSLKGGAAAIMQSAAEINERLGLVDPKRETIATAEGMAVIETQIPGQVVSTEFVAGQPVHSEIKPVSTQHSVAATDAMTIGQGLLPRGRKLVPMVPTLLGALALYGNVSFSARAAMGAGESSGSFEDCFFGVPAFLGVGEENTKPVEKYVELPTKHEPILKLSQEERPLKLLQ